MIASLRIKSELLLEMLHLPSNTKIHSARVEKTNGECVIALEVEHEDIKSESVIAAYYLRTKKEIEFAGWREIWPTEGTWP